MDNYVHLGGRIESLLEEQNKTRRDLASDIGMSAGNVSYLLGKESMDVQTLHKIGNALKFNFFKYFPINDGAVKQDAAAGEHAKALEAKQKEIDVLKSELAEMVKAHENLERDFTMVKQENGYLKEINALLKRK